MAEKGKKSPSKKTEDEAPTDDMDNLPAVSKKHNYKVTPAAARAIIELTLQGVTVREIINHLKSKFGISVRQNCVTDYRRKYRHLIIAAWDDELASARAMYPDTSILVGRMGTLDKAIKNELSKKKKMNARSVAELVAAADAAIYHAEMLRLRTSESERKYPTRSDDAHERVMRELERRSHAYRNITKEAEETKELFKKNMDLEEDIVAEAEVIPDEQEPAPPARKADVSDEEDMIGKAMMRE